MKRFLLVAALVLAALPAFAMNVNFVAGEKFLKPNDWSPVNHQRLLGLHLDASPTNWGLAFSVDLFGTEDESSATRTNNLGAKRKVKIRGATNEIDVGLRKYIGDIERIAGFLGGGIVLASGLIETRDPLLGRTYDDNEGAGLFVDGGINLRPVPHLNVGVDLRISRVNSSLLGYEREFGGSAVLFYMGYGW